MPAGDGGSPRAPVPDDFARELGGLVPLVDVPAGPWDPPEGGLFAGAVGVLVVRGLLLHDLQLDRGGATELLGPGDLLRVRGGPDELLPFATGFLAAEHVRLAVLDAHLPRVLERWPDVGARIIASSAARHRRQALHRVASQLPRVEERLLALFWLIAEQWGRVVPDGVLVPLSLTHELLGRLVGARRPTVTMAIGQLVEAGHIRRRPDRSFVLAPASRRLLTPQQERVSRVADIAVLDADEPRIAPGPEPVGTPDPGPRPRHAPDAAEHAARVRARAAALGADQRRAVARAEVTVQRSAELLARSRARRGAPRA